MMETTELLKHYARFRNYLDEVGAFFRHKEQYSIAEQLGFLTDFSKCHALLERFCEENEQLKNGESLAIGYNKNGKRLTLSKTGLQSEHDAVVSVAYFNLSNEQLAELHEYAKVRGMLQEAMILKRMFDRYVMQEPILEKINKERQNEDEIAQ